MARLIVFGIVFFIVSMAISFTAAYFSIKFVINIGDKIFGGDESSQTSQDLEHQESYYVGVCTEEVLKQDKSAKQDKTRDFCKCTYDAVLEAAGSKENFISYQNSASEDTLAELNAHCRTAYRS